MRAVEQGLPLIRSANTGVSAYVDAHGRLISGIDFNEQGFVDATLSSATGSTIDDRMRNAYFWLAIGLVGIIALISRMGFISRAN